MIPYFHSHPLVVVLSSLSASCSKATAVPFRLDSVAPADSKYRTVDVQRLCPPKWSEKMSI